jgi:hypothetical protein
MQESCAEDMACRRCPVRHSQQQSALFAASKICNWIRRIARNRCIDHTYPVALAQYPGKNSNIRLLKDRYGELSPAGGLE